MTDRAIENLVRVWGVSTPENTAPKLRCYVMQINAIAGNRVSNEDGVAACYHNDTLTYAAPTKGAYGHSFAVMANTIHEARTMLLGMAGLTPIEIIQPREPKKSFRDRVRRFVRKKS